MNRDLHEKIGAVEFPQLFASIDPPARLRGGTIAKGDEEVTLKRGTLLGKKGGKLSIYGGDDGSSPDCILADDVTIGTDDDENVVVYVTGDFNIDALIVADGYTITEADKDVLRTKGILLGTVEEP